jgi:purine catabolism regulator
VSVGINRLQALTLGELLDGDLGLELIVGGEDARARRIAGAHSIEIEHSSTWLGRDWIMLTTGVRLRNTEAQRQLAAELDEIGVAALGFGVEVVFKRVPSVLLQEARSRGLPVFSIPLRTPFRDVITTVNTALLSSEVRATQRLASLQLYLVDALEEENPRSVVIERLAAFVSARVTLFLAEGRVAEATGPAPTEAIWREITSRPAALVQFDDDGWETIATPLHSGMTEGPWLAVSRHGPQPMARLTRAAARAAAPILTALERLENKVQAQEGAIQAARLNALLDGDDADFGALAARAAAVGIDGAAPLSVVAIGTASPGPGTGLYSAVERHLHERSLPALLGTRHGTCVALIQAPLPELRAAVDYALVVEPATVAGIGRPVHDIAGIPHSLRDAEIALERARALPACRVLAFEDLDLATLIAANLESERLTFKVDQIAEALRANQGLFDTVVAYFEHDLDVMRTSKALHLHHNSLRYRLGRVEQILGRPLKDPATIASLYIALTACEHRPCRS